MLTYDLPQELIAQKPCEPRDKARLLTLERATGKISHDQFRDLPAFLRSGDVLVLNDTRVIPARLRGVSPTGGKVQLLLLRREGEDAWWCLGQPGERLKAGSKMLFDHGSVKAEVVSAQGAERLVRFSATELSGPANQFGGEGRPIDQILEKLGQIPLPPYIKRMPQAQDADWYQTVFARNPGAVAAPTAGLHFTEQVLEDVRKRGVRIAMLTLHVGWGTFKPVGEEELKKGSLHEEAYEIPAGTLEAVEKTRAAGGRVVAVGTTVARALETFARDGKRSGSTGLFIRPPHKFRLVDALVTNFHLPGTSLLLLVTAFAGEGPIRAAYKEAVQKRYRFYSYGDAMFII